MQLDEVARKFYKDLPEEISIKALTDAQAKTIYIALKSIESKTARSNRPLCPLLSKEGEADCKPASDAQIRAIMGIIFSRYEKDYKAISAALRKYAPAVITRLRLKEGQNVYLPNFYAEIKKSAAEADKLIKRFDAVKAGERKKER